MYLQHVWAVVFTSLCTDFPIPQRQPMEEQLEFENSPRSVFRRRHVTRPTRMMSASLANTRKNIMRVSSSACLQQCSHMAQSGSSQGVLSITKHQMLEGHMHTSGGYGTSCSRKLLSVLDNTK